MSDESIVPNPVPSVVPNPVGPALSYSSVAAQTSRATHLLDRLQQKVKSHLQSRLDAVGKVGAAIENKVLSRLADKLNSPEQTYNEVVDHIHNMLAAGMAPAMATIQDMDAAIAAAGQPSLKPAAEQATVSPPQRTAASTQQHTPTPPTIHDGGTLINQPQAGLPFYLLGENNPGLSPPGPCKMLSQSEWQTLHNAAQAVADACTPTPEDYSLGFRGNWWRCSEDCCVIGPARAPADNVAPPKAKYFDMGIDGYPSCALAGFASFMAQWNPQALQCGATPPVDCKQHPTDPSCPVDCFVNPTDPRCQPKPCPPGTHYDAGVCVPDTTCPPPCPTLTIPDCVNVTLCDWDKLCDVLKRCLVQAKEDCALDNDTAYVFKDCEGTFGQQQREWWSTAADSLAGAGSVTDAVQPTTTMQQQAVEAATVGRDLF